MGPASLALTWVAGLFLSGAAPAVVLPTGDARPAIEFKHFPSPLHAFVWRNWELISLERMAEVLETTPQKVRELGESMGLPPHERPPAEYARRGYISIIRRNWHLLPYEQLLTLLGWDAGQLAFTLREDDFLWIKLGSMKPACPALRYTRPNDAQASRCAQMRAIVSRHFADAFDGPSARRFDFLRDFSAVTPETRSQASSRNESTQVRFLYSYAGVFGDPLLSPDHDPYPEGLLQRLARLGVNGVWLHVVLRQLAPSPIFPEFGTGHEQRLANLHRLVERARRHGIDIYLYMNEPRAMEASFFEDRPDMKGVQEADHFALCTSAPQVRQWLSDSLAYVFQRVPGLGGVFTITASENLTNCYSHGRTAAGCPRCAKRSGPQVIAEVNKAIADGVWAGDPNARVIVWDWGWPDGTGPGWGGPDWSEQIIRALPNGVYLMSVSEWGKPIVRGGVAGHVGEYSLSAVGPGPRASRHWALAKQRGLKTVAKVQVNCSWELSAVPYLPVMNLVARHCSNLANADIDGWMLSWSVGGYPSPNLQLVSQFDVEPIPDVDEVLARAAQMRYGTAAVRNTLSAWSKFSDAFAEYPFHTGLLYQGPVQCGPANLFYPEPTGYRATMVGFPYDDLDGWRAIYPADVLASQFEKVAAGWTEGLAALQSVPRGACTAAQQANLHADVGLAEAAGLHFRSVANQVRFIVARDALRSGSLSDSDRRMHVDTIRRVAEDEIRNARRLFALTRADSRIGFEASNHYYYLPPDLVEKVINCEYILNTWLLDNERGRGAPP